MDKLVSIILPVYGVEKYLSECVDSLLVQTYNNLEIILVDDASPDSCGAICDSYAACDSRVRVIHKKNGGAASARNAGLEISRGDYICFVDSDDTVEPDYVKTLLETVGDGDMAMCGFSFRCRSGSRPKMVATGSYDREGFMMRFLEDWSCSLLWNKIFRRESVGDLRMAEGHRIDDEFFTYQVALNCRKISVTDECLYHYRMRGSSVMQDDGTVKERIMLDRISYVTQRYRIVGTKLPTLRAAYFADAADTLCRYWRYSLGMSCAQKMIRNWAMTHITMLLLMGKRGLIYLKCFLLTKPQYCGEPNPLQFAEDEFFT